MDPIDAIAERRIREAIKRGEFDSLPSAGQPLELDDDGHVPPELRVAYRILKNSGFLPPEVELRREIHEAQSLIAAATNPIERGRGVRCLELLRLRFNGAVNRNMLLDEAYYHEVNARFDRLQKDQALNR